MRDPDEPRIQEILPSDSEGLNLLGAYLDLVMRP
jgi:hypothetical protein